MPFTVKTQSFEGPLDLLLELIEHKKLFINDVSLAKVTDDFIEHVKRFDKLPMDESAHFILVASTLLLIKSKSLLPDLNLTEEERGDIRDLEIRLKIYQKIKSTGKKIQELFGGEIIFPRQAKDMMPVFAPDPNLSLEKVSRSLKDLIDRMPKKETLPKVTVKKIVSLEEMIGRLTNRIQSQLKMSFGQFAREHKAERIDVIVSFLAMLELVKQGMLQVSQEATFGEIQMETKDVGIPRY